jgi:hypothetical protein
MKIHISPDREKAQALKEMAQTSLERIQESNKEKYPSHTLLDYYTIIHQLLEAESIGQGVKFTGEGAHRDLINWFCQ